jgi:hypothetical protein
MPRFCPNCGEEISDKVKFCTECGVALDALIQKNDPSPVIEQNTQNIETYDKKIKESNNQVQNIESLKTESSILKNTPDILFYLGICIFLMVILLIVAPTKTVTNTIEVAYTDNQTYFEKEPYEIQEAYFEQVPYQTTETYTDSVPVPVSVPYQGYETSYQNYDAGTGKYYSTISSGCTCTSTRYMNDKDGNYGALCVQLSCLISSPVTKYRIEYQQESVQKERPVTKYQNTTRYRNVTQYRDVLKTREVMRTRIDQQQSEVNWLLGFKTPYKLHLPIISGV